MFSSPRCLAGKRNRYTRKNQNTVFRRTSCTYSVGDGGGGGLEDLRGWISASVTCAHACAGLRRLCQFETDKPDAG